MINFAVSSQKRGVGKTTLSINLAHAFARAGVRTLLVDADPQGSVGLSLTRQSRLLTVREFAAAIAKAGGNVEELITGLESAPMSGHPMFRAHGVISMPEHVATTALTAAIESLGGDLTVDVCA